MTLTIGSLFSGIGGLELGLERAGVGRVVWQCEIDPFCRAVLAKHWPDVTRFEDVTAKRDWPHVDLVCGGFPCQDVSGAGKGAGLAGARSGLWYQFARILEAVQPSLVVVENVASGKSRWLPQVRRHLHVLGYGTRALGIGADDVGAPFDRKRIFVVAVSNGFVGEKRNWNQPNGSRSIPSEGSRRLEPHPWNWDGVRVRRRVADGIPRRLDARRIRALGNAVLPQCAEAVGRLIVSEYL